MDAVFTADLLPFIVIGFLAQIIDGTLGMAFGVIASTLLLSMGVPPAAASAGVHVAKMATGAVGGVSHAMAGNVDWRLLARIAVPGILGGIAGAWLLSSVNPALARPVVFGYLAILSIYIMIRAARARAMALKPKVVEPVGAAGGFLDAIGGGGWGPVVTSNLLAQGSQPRQTIGTVNLAEFFVTSAISGAFFVVLDEQFLSAPILGLVLGGIIAAPIGALLVRRVPARPLMAAVGLILLLTSSYGLWKAVA